MATVQYKVSPFYPSVAPRPRPRLLHNASHVSKQRQRNTQTRTHNPSSIPSHALLLGCLGGSRCPSCCRSKRVIKHHTNGDSTGHYVTSRPPIASAQLGLQQMPQTNTSHTQVSSQLVETQRDTTTTCHTQNTCSSSILDCSFLYPVPPRTMMATTTMQPHKQDTPPRV